MNREQWAVILFVIFAVGGIGFWLGYMEYALKLDHRYRYWPKPSKTRLVVECPYCQKEVWGSPENIDSGLRKHKEYCEEWPEDQSFSLF